MGFPPSRAAPHTDVQTVQCTRVPHPRDHLSKLARLRLPFSLQNEPGRQLIQYVSLSANQEAVGSLLPRADDTGSKTRQREHRWSSAVKHESQLTQVRKGGESPQARTRAQVKSWGAES